MDEHISFYLCYEWIRIFLFTVFSAKGNIDDTGMRFLMRLRKRKHKVYVRHMSCWFSARFIELHLTFICISHKVKTHQGQTSSRYYLYLSDGSCIRYIKKSSTNWFVLHGQVSNVQSNKKLQCLIATILVLFPRTYFDGYQTYLIVLVSSYTLYTKYDNSSNFCVILGYFWCIFDYCSS